MRLGDLDALKEKVNAFYDELFVGCVSSDLITYAQGVDCIIDNAPTFDVTKNQAYDQGFITAMRLYSRPQGEWIPVSERLPDKNMPCLVSVGKFNFTQIAMYSDLMETIDHKIFYQGDYGKNNFQNITEYVKAWQPLPEPYKKGGAE